MAAVRGAHSCNAMRRTVGIVRVGLRDGAVVVHIPERGQLSIKHCLEGFRIGKVGAALSMCDPNTKRGAFHPLEKNRRGRLYLNG
eukprot:scaffold263427_cov45-Tisochrysis_lutea.AAC.2